MAKYLMLMYFVLCQSFESVSQESVMPGDNSILNYGPSLHPVQEQPMYPDYDIPRVGNIVEQKDPFDEVNQQFKQGMEKALSSKNYEKLGAIQYVPQDSVNKYTKSRISIFGISTGEAIGGYIPGAQNIVPSFSDRLHIRTTDLLILSLGVIVVILSIALIKIKKSNLSK